MDQMRVWTFVWPPFFSLRTDIWTVRGHNHLIKRSIPLYCLQSQIKIKCLVTDFDSLSGTQSTKKRLQVALIFFYLPWDPGGRPLALFWEAGLAALRVTLHYCVALWNSNAAFSRGSTPHAVRASAISSRQESQSGLIGRPAGCWASEPKHAARNNPLKNPWNQAFISRSGKTISKYFEFSYIKLRPEATSTGLNNYILSRGPEWGTVSIFNNVLLSSFPESLWGCNPHPLATISPKNYFVFILHTKWFCQIHFTWVHLGTSTHLD